MPVAPGKRKRAHRRERVKRVRCLKCGLEIPENAVFCQKCLEIMQTKPIAPGLAIQLPRKGKTPPAKKQPKKEKPLKEQIAALKRTRSKLTVAVILLSMVLCLTAAALFFALRGGKNIGQNYTIDTKPQSSGTSGNVPRGTP